MEIQGRVVQSPIKLIQGARILISLSFVTFWLGNLFILFALVSLKLHQTLEVKEKTFLNKKIASVNVRD